MSKDKLLSNLKHLPSTIAGGSLALVGLLALPQVNNIVSILPAKAQTTIGGIGIVAAGLVAIFGMGKTEK